MFRLVSTIALHLDEIQKNNGGVLKNSINIRSRLSNPDNALTGVALQVRLYQMHFLD